jgi:hypothetical protein
VKRRERQGQHHPTNSTVTIQRVVSEVEGSKGWETGKRFPGDSRDVITTEITVRRERGRKEQMLRAYVVVGM